MEFYAPQRLFLLLIPAALFVWALVRRGRAAALAHPKIQRAEASARHLTLTARPHGSAAAPKPPSLFAKINAARPLLYLGLALGIVALARPQYGQREIPVFEQSREVLIALDLSRSMLAEDIKPTRLARAKLLISSLLERLAGERVGLVLFSGTAFLQSPLSADYEILRDFLPELGPDTLPEGGTNYRALLDTALQAFSDTPATDRFLIVLSDGESTDDTWPHALPALEKRGVRAITLGIGTPGGAMLPDGEGGFVKDERGAIVLSKLEPATLRQLAQETEGLYRDASTWLDLAALIRETVEQGQRGQFTDTRVQRLIDRYQWALAPALLLLALSFWLEFPITPRPRELAPRRKPSPTNAAARAAALLLLLGLFLAAPAELPAQGAQTPSSASAQPPPELSAIGKIVSRLATQSTAPTGRDWAELARETVTWGQKLQDEQHPVPPSPVHDALLAVQLGEALDSGTADWPTLRRELEALLAAPPPEPQQEQQEQKPPPQSGDQSDSQDQRGQQGGSPEQSQPSGGEGDSSSDQDSQNPQDAPNPQSSTEGRSDSAQQPESPPATSPDADTQEPSPQSPEDSPPPTPPAQSDPQQPQPRAGESAFGDMQQDAGPPDTPSPPDSEPPAAPPPTQQGKTQQVGGAQPKDASALDAQDPALSAPLQKLQKIRDEDSPAQLFQMMNDDAPKDAPSHRKNW